MKKILLIGALFALLTACTSAQHEKTPPKLGGGNPASVYCVEQGGKLSIKNEANGQVGYCHLPSGQVVEEWGYFRNSQTECLAEEAKKLVGQTVLTEAKIKAKTKSSIVRMVKPGQPVTMDYRVERVTITIDPINKKVLTASCG